MWTCNSKIELLNLPYFEGSLEILADIRPAVEELQIKEPFMEYLGGEVHILENFWDFALIPVVDLDREESNLMVRRGDFDMCEEIPGTGIWKILLITSNSGGPIWYVPKHLAAANPFVKLSATN